MGSQTRIFAVLAITVFASCATGDEGKTLDISQRFNADVRILISSGDSIMNIANVERSDWDSMYVFQPYVPPSQINKTLGINWLGENFNLTIDDTFSLIVFVHKGKVAAFAKLSRTNGDFMKVNYEGPFKRSDSEFVLRYELLGNQRWAFWYHAKRHEPKRQGR